MQRERSAQKTIIMDMDMVLMNLRVCVISLVNEFDNSISEHLVKKTFQSCSNEPLQVNRIV